MREMRKTREILIGNPVRNKATFKASVYVEG